MSTDVTYCPAPGCGRRLRGGRCDCGWAAPGAAPAPEPTAEGDDERRRCPDCAEWIMAAARVCRFCGADLERAAKKGRAPSGRRRAARIAAPARGKDPALAAVLSFLFVGLGQFYCDEGGRALMFMGGAVAAAVVGALAAIVLETPAPAFLGPASVWVWSIFDAYALASSRPRR